MRIGIVLEREDQRMAREKLGSTAFACLVDATGSELIKEYEYYDKHVVIALRYQQSAKKGETELECGKEITKLSGIETNACVLGNKFLSAATTLP